MVRELGATLGAHGLQFSDKKGKNLLMKIGAGEESCACLNGFSEEQYVEIDGLKLKYVSEMMILGCCVSAEGGS
eukprot:10313069-Karenia_brevis.AAC.1